MPLLQPHSSAKLAVPMCSACQLEMYDAMTHVACGHSFCGACCRGPFVAECNACHGVVDEWVPNASVRRYVSDRRTCADAKQAHANRLAMYRDPILRMCNIELRDARFSVHACNGLTASEIMYVLLRCYNFHVAFTASASFDAAFKSTVARDVTFGAYGRNDGRVPRMLSVDICGMAVSIHGCTLVFIKA
jgi:hypothetical protein